MLTNLWNNKYATDIVTWPFAFPTSNKNELLISVLALWIGRLFAVKVLQSVSEATRKLRSG